MADSIVTMERMVLYMNSITNKNKHFTYVERFFIEIDIHNGSSKKAIADAQSLLILLESTRTVKLDCQTLCCLSCVMRSVPILRIIT